MSTKTPCIWTFRSGPRTGLRCPIKGKKRDNGKILCGKHSKRQTFGSSFVIKYHNGDSVFAKQLSKSSFRCSFEYENGRCCGKTSQKISEAPFCGKHYSAARTFLTIFVSEETFKEKILPIILEEHQHSEEVDSFEENISHLEDSEEVDEKYSPRKWLGKKKEELENSPPEEKVYEKVLVRTCPRVIKRSKRKGMKCGKHIGKYGVCNYHRSRRM